VHRRNPTGDPTKDKGVWYVVSCLKRLGAGGVLPVFDPYCQCLVSDAAYPEGWAPKTKKTLCLTGPLLA
jgi:hypothetical protein